MASRHSTLLLLRMLLMAAGWTHAHGTVVGCDGFVLAPDVDLSSIEVKLDTPEGVTKYSTDCAPNNGYYFLPLHDRGRFLLRVAAPAGWSFEPQHIELNVDGTDACSQGQDVNFVFTGYTVSGGPVMHADGTVPAANVTLELVSDSDGVRRSTVSQQDGTYVFPSVPAGAYHLVAQHPAWTLSAQAVPVVVKENEQVTLSPMVSGYSLQASVHCEGEPVQGVALLLFSSHVSGPRDCGPVPVPPEALARFQDTADQPVCGTVSSSDGLFHMRNVPAGTHRLVPVYFGDSTTYDVAPAELQVTVEHASLVLETPFEVKGFTISGRVVTAGQRRGVVGAAVQLNDGAQSTETDDQGNYQLPHVSTGQHVLHASKAGMHFEPLAALVLPSTPRLPDLVASAYDLCGSLNVPRPPVGARISTTNVYLKTPEGSELGYKPAVDGKFCFKVGPGSYILQAVPSAGDQKLGLAFYPSSRTVVTEDGPAFGQDFDQEFSSISGRVQCMGECENVTISLQHVERNVKMVANVTAEEDGTYSFFFGEVLLGSYKVINEQHLWCWKDKSFEVTAQHGAVDDLVFVQVGYALRIVTSHKTDLVFALQDSNTSKVDTLSVEKGKNKLCLHKAGIYRVTPKSCFRFEQDEYEYHTGTQEALHLQAKQYLVNGTIHVEREVDLVLHAAGAEGGLTRQVTVEKAGVAGEPTAEGKHPVVVYTYSFWVDIGEQIVLSPSGGDLLFSPRRLVLDTRDRSCAPLEPFVGRDGYMLTGGVTPPVADVQVTVEWKGATPDNATRQLITHTLADGTYAAGPFQDEEGGTFEVSATLDGYEITAIDSPPRNFAAAKLGTLVVYLRDALGAPLPDVLVSVSGGSQFRSNTYSPEGGSLAYSNLKPGQYFVKPLVKEFAFEPANKLVDVSAGSFTEVAFAGQRLGFSCSGQVTSLNGRGERMTVQAVPQNNDGLVEEMQCDTEGRYRLRGLKPGVYDLRLVSGSKTKVNLGRAIPSQIRVEIKDFDVMGANFLALRDLGGVDVTGSVDARPELLPMLLAKLCLKSAPDSVLQTAALGPTGFFEFRSLPRKEQDSYIVQLDTTLSVTEYSFSLPAPVPATARHTRLCFEAEPRRSSNVRPVPFAAYVIYGVVVACLALATKLIGLLLTKS